MRGLFLAAVVLLARVQGHCLDSKRAACAAGADSAQRSSPAVDHYISDPVLRRTWAVVIDCGHPQWPPQIQGVQIQGPQIQRVQSAAEAHFGALHAPAEAVVRPGSRVEVWSEGQTRVQLSGIALESGSVGQAVKVRAGLGVRPLCGKVRGPHSVELIRDNATCQRESR